MREPENEDGRPDHDKPGGELSGLPGLPPEWGRIIIPDDPAALAAEAEEIRRELRANRSGWARRLSLRGPRLLRGPRRDFPVSSAPRISLLVLAIATFATLAGLLVTMWPGPSRPSPGSARETGGRRTLPAGPADPAGRALPALEVVDGHGAPIALRSLLPAVIILAEDCQCSAAVTAAASVVPPGVTVIALFSGVSRPAPLPPVGPATAGAPVRSLADPAGGLRSFLRTPARPGEAATLLVGSTGEIVRFLPAPTSTLDYQADLSRLALARASQEPT